MTESADSYERDAPLHTWTGYEVLRRRYRPRELPFRWTNGWVDDGFGPQSGYVTSELDG